MQFLLFLMAAALLPSTGSATEIRDWNVKRYMGDGKAANCAKPHDADRAAYGPQTISLSAQGRSIQLRLEMKGLYCRRSGETYFWESRDFHQAIPLKTIDGTAAELRLARQEFILLNEEYQPIGTTNISEMNIQSIAPISHDIDLDLALGAERRRSLERGEDVKVRWQIFLRGIGTVYKSDGTVIPLGMRAGGSFFIHFVVRQSESGQISLFPVSR